MPDYRVSYSGMDDKMLSQGTDVCQLVWYVGQFQVAYFLVLHWHLKVYFFSSPFRGKFDSGMKGIKFFN